MLFLIIFGKHTAKAPMVFFNFLNHDMRLIGPFIENAHQGIGNLTHQLRALITCGALGDLNIYIRHNSTSARLPGHAVNSEAALRRKTPLNRRDRLTEKVAGFA